MTTEELRVTLKSYSQYARDLLDYLIIAGDRKLNSSDFLILKDMKRKGLVAEGASGYYYFATGLSTYWKERLQENFQ